MNNFRIFLIGFFGVILTISLADFQLGRVTQLDDDGNITRFVTVPNGFEREVGQNSQVPGRMSFIGYKTISKRRNVYQFTGAWNPIFFLFAFYGGIAAMVFAVGNGMYGRMRTQVRSGRLNQRTVTIVIAVVVGIVVLGGLAYGIQAWRKKPKFQQPTFDHPHTDGDRRDYITF